MRERRVAFDIDVPGELLQLSAAFHDAGHGVFLVGGAVRDAVMGNPPKDFDLATDASPDRVRAVVERLGLRVLDVGVSFGVSVVVFPGPVGRVEIATFREDMTAGRHPSVRFSTIDADVMRRDFTINALFYDMSSRVVVDIVGGLDDIRDGVMRTVGEPAHRFAEDPLRVLRAVRFANRFGYVCDARVSDAIRAHGPLVGVSPERVHDEFVKAIASAKDVVRLSSVMDELGLWPHVFPGLRVSPAHYTLREHSNDPVIVVALLLDAEDPALVRRRLHELKYSRHEVDAVTFLLRLRSLDVANALSLRRLFKTSGVSTQQAMRYVGMRGSPCDRLMGAFLSYTVHAPVSGDDLLLEGYVGKELGIEMESRERETFRRLLG